MKISKKPYLEELCGEGNIKLPKIKILPVHPPPIYEKTIGEWIETLAEENHISFRAMFLYITKRAKDIGFINTITKLTGVSRSIITKLENQFKMRYWEKKRICIVKGCNFRRRDNYHLFEHLENVLHLGDGWWYFCRICGFKAKLIKDFETHLRKKHTLTEIKKYYKE